MACGSVFVRTFCRNYGYFGKDGYSEYGQRYRNGSADECNRGVFLVHCVVQRSRKGPFYD